MAVKNDWEKKFSYRIMQQLMSYMLTKNCESQVVAADANAYDLQTTGGKGVVLNGDIIALPADAAFDISGEPAYAAWAASASYVTRGALSEVTHIDPDGILRHYVCILAHTSAAADEPMVGANWATYWRLLPVWAETGDLDVVEDGETKYYLVCALYDGVLRIFKAYDASGNLQIPAYDPTRYVPLAIAIYANAAGDAADDVIGAAATGDWGTYGTFQQLTGFVFPDVSLLDLN